MPGDSHARTELALDLPSREHDAAERGLASAGRRAARVGTSSDQALSVGVGVPPDAPATQLARSRGIPVIRRSSGGTGVLVRRRDILWSIVVPRTPRGPLPPGLHAYTKLGEAVVATLADVGVAGEWKRSPGLSDEFCLLGRRGSALAVDGRVVGGAAQHVTSRALLHHGIVLRSIDRELLAQLFTLDRATLERSTTSLDELGVPSELGRFERAILRELGRTAEIVPSVIGGALGDREPRGSG